MRIGIDAKWLHAGPPSGRRVVRTLIEGLAEVAHDDEIHVFLDERARDATAPVPVPTARRHHVWAGNNQVANRWIVPRLADRLGLDAVVYQNFTPGRRHAHARVAFVYDVIFAERPEFFTWRERLYFRQLRALARRADRVCTISQSERARLVRLGYAAAGRTDVVPVAVDRGFAVREALGEGTVARALAVLGVREPFVLAVGRVSARKNVDLLVRALPLLRTEGLTLVVAGAPDRTAPDLGALADALGVRDRLRLLGAVDDEALRALYAAAVVFCFPSIDEGFGLPPLEAMASGTPVVVADTPVMRETCGDAARYVSATDPAAMAATIDAIAGDVAARTVAVAAGLHRAAAFTYERAARALLDSVHAAVRERA